MTFPQSMVRGQSALGAGAVPDLPEVADRNPTLGWVFLRLYDAEEHEGTVRDRGVAHVQL